MQWLDPAPAPDLQFLLLFTPAVCCVFCFHSCWCVVPAISTCRISKPMLLSLEAHGISERRCVTKHAFVLFTYAAFSPFHSNPGAFSPTVQSHLSAEQNKLRVVVSVYFQTNPGVVWPPWFSTSNLLWILVCGKHFLICTLLNFYAEW